MASGRAGLEGRPHRHRMRRFRAPTGLPGFTLVASGQLVSILGSEMSQFGLMLWAFEQTGLATSLALIGFFHFLPLIAVSPFAGALVDRSNRKLMMMLSDLGSAAATLMVFGLYLGGGLQIGHLYLAAAVSGAFHAFQWPAFSAAVSTMVPKEQYGRANGLLSLSESMAGIGAPMLAAVLYGLIGIGGLLIIDLLSFLVAIGALWVVKVPQPRQSVAGREPGEPAAGGGLRLPLHPRPPEPAGPADHLLAAQPLRHLRARRPARHDPQPHRQRRDRHGHRPHGGGGRGGAGRALALDLGRPPAQGARRAGGDGGLEPLR